MLEIKGRNGGVLKLAEKGDVFNPAGRPKKLVTELIQELRDAGCERLTPNAIREVSEYLLSLPIPDLVRMGSDPAQSAFIRIMCKGLVGSKGWESVQAVLDRVHGKPKQSLDISEQIPESSVNWAVVSIENKRKILDMLERDGAI